MAAHMPLMGLLALVALSAVQTAAAVGATDKTVIGIIGDWGMGPDGIIQAAEVTNNYPMQKAVANALGDFCQAQGCQLVLGMGDNFYDAGINSVLGVKDPQWYSSWDGVYTHSYLQNIPFWHSIGNHDYGYPIILNYTDYSTNGFVFNATTARQVQHANFSLLPQIEYTWSDPKGRWKLPGRFYNQLFSSVPVKFGLTVMDSSPYYFLYCCDLNSSVSNFDPLYDINNEMIKGTYPTARPCDAKNDPKYNTSEMAYACKDNQRAAQAQWAKRSLQNYNSLGVWNIWVGHHPPLNIGEGLGNPYSFYVKDVLNAPGAKPHFALSGHEHVLALNKNQNISNGTVFASIGSSGNVQKTLKDPSLGAWNASGIFNYGTGYNGAGYGASDTLRSDTLGWDLGDWKFQAAYSGFSILTLNDTHGTIAFYGYKFPTSTLTAAQQASVAATPSSSFTKLYEHTITKF